MDLHAPTCPKCGSADVRSSSRSARGLFKLTYRCRSCKRHFRRATFLGYAVVGTVILVPLLVAGVLVGFFGQQDGVGDSPGAAEQAEQARLAEARLALARKGDAEAQFKVGLASWSSADYQKAFPWIKAAADHGHTEARYYLGMAYLYGRGTIQNFQLAQQHLEEAAKLGNLEAQYMLGVMYRDGMGVQRSREHAYAWLNIAAAAGHLIASTERDKLAYVMTSEAMAQAQTISLGKLGEIAKANATPAAKAQPAAPAP